MTYMEDIFAGTAKYYDKFRPLLPDEGLNYIIGAVKVPVTLLDLGTGTGRVLEQFAPYFTDIIAVEPQHDMLKIARKHLAPYPVHFIQDAAENMRLPQDWHASLVTIGWAFHWMNRNVVLRKLESVVAPNGVIAVFYDHSFIRLNEPWCEAIRSLITEFLGEQRLTTKGPYQKPAHPYSQDFARSAFTRVQKQTIPILRHWNVEQIIGMVFSTSYASKALLGKHASRFEERLRAMLLQLSPQDDFVEHNTLEIFIARRPTL